MAALIRFVYLLAACAYAAAQQYEEERPRYSQQKAVTTPVPILKQIDRHNEDGSYTYGFEAADGTFKIETKEATGEVKGKYGYTDDTGKVRVIEYGANKYGFQPSGEGITVAPPTFVDESTSEEGLRPKGQPGRAYNRAQPVQQAVDYDYEENTPPPRAAPPRPVQQYRPAPPAPAPPHLRPAAPAPPKPQFFSGAAPAPVERESFFSPAPAPAPAPYKQPKAYRPQPQQQQNFNYQPQSQQLQSQPQPRYTEPQHQPQQHQPQQHQPQQHQFSMLDQLLKEYSLPQGGSRSTHDITFGTY